MTDWEKLWEESVMHNDYEGMRKAFYGLKADLETYREIHVKQISINHKRYEQLEAIRSYVSRALEVSNSLPDDLKKKRYMIDSNELCARILEVIGPSIDSDKKRST